MGRQVKKNPGSQPRSLRTLSTRCIAGRPPTVAGVGRRMSFVPGASPLRRPDRRLMDHSQAKQAGARGSLATVGKGSPEDHGLCRLACQDARTHQQIADTEAVADFLGRAVHPPEVGLVVRLLVRRHSERETDAVDRARDLPVGGPRGLRRRTRALLLMQTRYPRPGSRQQGTCPCVCDARSAEVGQSAPALRPSRPRALLKRVAAPRGRGCWSPSEATEEVQLIHSDQLLSPQVERRSPRRVRARVERSYGPGVACGPFRRERRAQGRSPRS